MRKFSKTLRYSSIGIFCAGIVSVLQGCDIKEAGLAAVLMLLLQFCSGPINPTDDGSTSQGPFIYWTTHRGDTIGRANLNGSNVDDSFITGANFACGLLVKGNYIYWGNAANGSIGRAKLNGTDINQSFITGVGDACGLAADDNFIYWGNLGTNTLGRANLDGTGADDGFANVDSPCGIAVDDNYIYWPAEQGNYIGRTDINGGNFKCS